MLWVLIRSFCEALQTGTHKKCFPEKNIRNIRTLRMKGATSGFLYNNIQMTNEEHNTVFDLITALCA